MDVVSESEDISEEDGSKTTVNYNEVMSSWSKLGTPLPVLKALYEKKFMEPTPIQVCYSLFLRFRIFHRTYCCYYMHLIIIF